MAKQLENYALGQWTKGSSEGQMLYNAINGEEIGTASSAGLDFGAMMDYARTVGGPVLRKMTFQERGLMLKKLALYLMDRNFTQFLGQQVRLVQILGLILKEELETYLPMHLYDVNSEINHFMLKEKRIKSLKTEHS